MIIFVLILFPTTVQIMMKREQINEMMLYSRVSMCPACVVCNGRSMTDEDVMMWIHMSMQLSFMWGAIQKVCHANF